MPSTYFVLGQDAATKSVNCNECVCVGGRYDNLVKLEALGEMEENKEKGVPCVGFSFDLDKILSKLEQKAKSQKTTPRTTETEVYVASEKSNLLDERLKMCKELWDSHINVGILARSLF